MQNICAKYTKKADGFAVKNVCCMAAIIGLDKTVWAQTPNFTGLNDYDHPLEGDDGSTTNVKISEFACAMAATEGKRNPTAAGIRLCKEKFMMISHDPDTNCVYLSRKGGGGCIVRTNKALVIGIWDKE